MGAAHIDEINASSCESRAHEHGQLARLKIAQHALALVGGDLLAEERGLSHLASRREGLLGRGDRVGEDERPAGRALRDGLLQCKSALLRRDADEEVTQLSQLAMLVACAHPLRQREGLT
eukprot:3865846-Pleurochrysis_carterae.AAC.3